MKVTALGAIRSDPFHPNYPFLCSWVRRSSTSRYLPEGFAINAIMPTMVPTAYTMPLPEELV